MSSRHFCPILFAVLSVFIAVLVPFLVATHRSNNPELPAPAAPPQSHTDKAIAVMESNGYRNIDIMESSYSNPDEDGIADFDYVAERVALPGKLVEGHLKCSSSYKCWVSIEEEHVGIKVKVKAEADIVR